jgi:molybdopterin-biosynthesis enzyme MoeA-like protein
MALRTAEIIAVGSELLGPSRSTPTPLHLGQAGRARHRAAVKSVVGDDREDLAAVLRKALARVDVVVSPAGSVRQTTI